MGWLSGWTNRYTIKVDSSQIDSALTNYPLPIFLRYGAGKSAFDATDIFKKLDPQDTVTISNLLDWYKGDLDGSNFKDSAGSRPLAPQGGGASSQDGLWGKVMDFDGTARALSSSCPTLGTTFTLSFWMKTASGGVDRDILAVGDTAVNFNCIIFLLNTSLIPAIWSQGGSTVAFDCYPLNNNRWHHVVLSFNNRVLTAYINGAVVYNGTPYASLNVQNGIIGLGATGAKQFVGQIADFRIFSTALSSTDVLNLYHGRPRKIAVTTDDGETECPVEIASFHPARMLGLLYAKIPSISASADTTLYLYYDPAKDENPNVGFPGSDAAKYVWDGNFVAVHHLSATDLGASNGFLDSTTNQLHGTHGNMERADYAKAWTTKGMHQINPDGTNERISLGANSLFDFTEAITLEAYINPDASPPTNMTMMQKDFNQSTAPYISWGLQREGTNWKWQFSCCINGTLRSLVSPNTFSANVEQYLAGSFDGSVMRIYNPDGSLAASDSNYSGPISHNTAKSVFICGGRYASSENFKGPCHEFRISKVARSAAWIKATAKGLNDQLVTISTEVSVVLSSALSMALSLLSAFSGSAQEAVVHAALSASFSLKQASVMLAPYSVASMRVRGTKPKIKASATN
ncbi:MAG: LamG domain-containing protein [Desulfobacterales bacterium]